MPDYCPAIVSKRPNPLSVATSDFLPVSLPADRPADGNIARIKIFDAIDAAEPIWRELEADAIQTPYQSRAWIGAWKRHVSPAFGERAMIVAALDTAGRPLLIAPLGVIECAGLRVARPFGGKHVNYNLPVFQGRAIGHLSGAAIAEALREAGRARGVDAIFLPNQPVEWLGHLNPLALIDGNPSPANSFRANLDSNPEGGRATISRDSRRKLRQKEKLLAESGPVHFGHADTPVAIKNVMDAYQAQKAEWFARNGGRNVFADPAVDNFLRAGALAGLTDGKAAIEVYYLSAGPHIAATFAGTAWGGRFSGMILSADIARFGRASPGVLLLVRVVDHLIARGMTGFDLGAGEARYKKMLCPVEEPLVDVTLPISPAGHVLARAWRGERRLRGWAKRNHMIDHIGRLGSRLRLR